MAEAQGSSENNPYQLAEDGWRELLAASEKIQKAADQIKKSDRSIDGYAIERTLNKHKPHLISEHLQGLMQFRQENKL